MADGAQILTATVAQNFAHQMFSAKCLDNSYTICLQMKQANPDLIIIARTYTHDCVPQWMLYSPAAWWDQIKHILPNGFDFYEIENECAPPDPMYPQWAYFSIDIAKLVAQDKGGAMLAFSFGPGWPAFNLIQYLIPYFEWADQNVAPNGFYHGVAWHASPYASFIRLDMPWINDPYIAGRPLLVRGELLEAGGPDLTTWNGQFWITEIGLSDGYSGNWNAAYSCAEVDDAYHTTKTTYENQGIVNGFTWWNFGKLGRWSDDSNCSVIIWG